MFLVTPRPYEAMMPVSISSNSLKGYVNGAAAAGDFRRTGSIHSQNSLTDRPLPSIPILPPAIQPHLIPQDHILDLETAVKLGQVGE